MMKVTSYAKQYAKELAEEFKKRTQRASEVIAQELRKNLSSPGPAPSKPGEFPHMQSGRMVKGVRTVVGKRSPYTVRVKINAPHADAQEFGARGGTIIRPKNVSALKFRAWGAGGGGKTVFAASVKKGVLAARAPIKKTLEGCREKVRKIYTRGIPALKGKGNKAIVRIT